MTEHLVAIVAEYLPRGRVSATVTWKSIDMAGREDFYVIGDIMVSESVLVPTPRLREEIRTFDSEERYNSWLETMQFLAAR